MQRGVNDCARRTLLTYPAGEDEDDDDDNDNDNDDDDNDPSRRDRRYVLRTRSRTRPKTRPRIRRFMSTARTRDIIHSTTQRRESERDGRSVAEWGSDAPGRGCAAGEGEARREGRKRVGGGGSGRREERR